MRILPVLMGAAMLVPLAAASNASAETREEYLARLKDICSVECLEPKPFQRAARKRDAKDDGDMAVIMDVAFVRLNGDRFELFDRDLEGSALVEQAILGSAGVNTSSSNGIGGLPRGSNGVLDPNVIVIDLDAQAFADFLNTPQPEGEPGVRAADGDGIIVDGEREREVQKPTLAVLRSAFRNRRIVVRGTPRLTAQWIGARRDYRRKQVTLVVDNADDLVLLPRFDQDGEARAEDLPWLAGEAPTSGK